MVDMSWVFSKILILFTLGFCVAIAWTPLLTHLLYKYRMGKSIRSAVTAPMFAELHKKKAGVPTMGGLLMWITTAVLALGFSLVAHYAPESLPAKLSFLSRSETWLPLAALCLAGLVGVVDDVCNIYKIGPHGGGIRSGHRVLITTLFALVGAWWFYAKLGWDTLSIPFYGDIAMGWWYVPFFVLVIVATAFSVNQTDGLDGLAGGTLASAYASFAIIALLQGKEDLAALCAVIVGTICAFLWFNIYPARFIMGDTGAMSLGVTLGVVAMLTNSALLLPLIGVVFVTEAVTTMMQLASKRWLHRKIFLIAPIHHHFEAKGWPEPKVVMRFWVIGWMGSGIALALAFMHAAVR